MKAIVVWLWNDPLLEKAEAAPAPPKPPFVPPVDLPKMVPGLRVDMQPKLTWRQRQAWRIAQGLPRRGNRPQQPAFPGGKIRPPRVFTAHHVNIAQKMFARHFNEPHKFICIADPDAAEGLSADVTYVPTPAAAIAVAHHRSPEGNRFPSCYRRLWSYSPEAKALADRILVVDIDVVVTRDVAPFWKPDADFVGWVPERAWGQQHRFGGGIYMLKTGTRTKVWTEFNGGAIVRARAAGFRGSDQAWMSYMLRDKEAYWPRNSGIHSVREMGPQLDLPDGARIVQFNGNRKPWDYTRIPWVAQHWR